MSGNILAATCLVTFDTASGTGILVSQEFVLTAWHVVQRAGSSDAVDVTFHEFGNAPEVAIRASVKAFDEDRDLCLLKLSAPTGREAAPIHDRDIREGTAFQATGYARERYAIPHLVRGLIAGVLPTMRLKIDLVVNIDPTTSLQDYQGMSGSAIVADGVVIGMLRATLNGGLAGLSTSIFAPLLRSNSIEVVEDTSAAADDSDIAGRDEFQLAFERQLVASNGRYLFLEGAAGIGKTTFCSTFRPRIEGLVVVGAYAVRPLTGTANRYVQSTAAQLFDWLTASVSTLVDGKAEQKQTLTYAAMATHTQQILSRLANYCRAEGVIAVILIDGLDEVAALGEHRIAEFLGILPPQLPAGVSVCLAGTQYARVSGTITLEIRQSDILALPLLGRNAAIEWCNSALTHDNHKLLTLMDDVCDLAAGHPLYLSYIVSYLNDHPDVESLSDFPTLTGPIEDYYHHVWNRLNPDPVAMTVLSLVARLRTVAPTSFLLSALLPQELASWETVQRQIGHLFVNRESASFMHESFGDFVISRTQHLEQESHRRLAVECCRPGLIGYGLRNRVFHCQAAGGPYEPVAQRECSQEWADAVFEDGGDVDSLLFDIAAVRDLSLLRGNVTESIRLLLLSSRMEYRHDVVLADSATALAHAYVAIGRPEDAVRAIRRNGILIVPLEAALQIGWSLVRANHIQSAVKLFNIVERACLGYWSRSDFALGAFVMMTVYHIYTLLMQRAGGRQVMPQVIRLVTHALDVVQNQHPDMPNEDRYVIEERVGGASDRFFFAVHDTYVSLDDLSRIPAADIRPDVLMYTRVNVIMGYEQLLSMLQLPVPKKSMKALLGDIDALVADTESLRPLASVHLVDALICAGASVETVRSVNSLVDLETQQSSTGRESNGVDVDWRAFGVSRRSQRLAAYLGQEGVNSSTTVEGTEDWERALFGSWDKLGTIDGKLRRAVSDGNAGDRDASVNDALELLTSELNFSLADRSKWKRAYALPEAIVPALYESVMDLLAETAPSDCRKVLEHLLSRVNEQCGLYTEGFRSLIEAVLNRLCRCEIDELTRVSFLALLRECRSHYIRVVKNRRELVGGLLRLVPLFSKVGAAEEARATFASAISRSMGPAWYKEDQFELLSTTLKVIPQHEHRRARFASVAAILEASSGELTFQRSVRQEKVQFGSELAKSGEFGVVESYFWYQIAGTPRQLQAELDRCEGDRVSPFRGGRFLGRGLDEQDFILEVVRRVPNISWRIRWALLEVFARGDERHVGRFANMFAGLIEEAGDNGTTVAVMARRLELIVSSDLSRPDAELFVEALKDSLPSRLHPAFLLLFEQVSAPRGEQHPRFKHAQQDGESSSNDDDDRMFAPGLFGRQKSVKDADKVIADIRSQLSLGNVQLALNMSSEVLTTIQEGEWGVWSHHVTAVIEAQKVISKHARSSSEILQLHAKVVAAERRTAGWKIARELMQMLTGRLSDVDAEAIADNTLQHFSYLLGDTSALQREFDEVFASSQSSSPDGAIEEFLLSMFSHPDPVRQEKCGEVVAWLASDESFAKSIFRAAASQNDGTSVLGCAALGFLSSASSRLALNESTKTADLVAGSSSTTSDIATASSSLLIGQEEQPRLNSSHVVDQQLSTETKAAPVSGEPPQWALDFRWFTQRAAKAGLLSSDVVREWEIQMRESCHPFTIEHVKTLYDELHYSFRTPSTNRFSRWNLKTWCALRRAIAIRGDENAKSMMEQALRMWNPSVPCLNTVPFERSLRSEIDEVVAGTRRFGSLISSNRGARLNRIESGRGWRYEILATLILRESSSNVVRLENLAGRFASTESALPETGVLGMDTCLRVVVEPAIFGSYSPAVPVRAFKEACGLTDQDFQSASWRCMWDSEVREGCELTVRNGFRVPLGHDLVWLIAKNGRWVMVNDGDNFIRL